MKMPGVPERQTEERGRGKSSRGGHEVYVSTLIIRILYDLALGFAVLRR